MSYSLLRANTVATSGTSISMTSSTAHNLLVAAVDAASISGNVSMPAGWQLARSIGTNNAIGIWYYPDCPSGITSVAPTNVTALEYGQILEFNDPGGINTTPLDQTGLVHNPAASSPVSIPTDSTITDSHELTVSYLYTYFGGGATKVTVGAGSGFTQSGQVGNGVKQMLHSAADYELNTSGTTITDAMTVSVTSWSVLWGVIATFKTYSRADLPVYNDAEGGTDTTAVTTANATGTGNTLFDVVV